MKFLGRAKETVENVGKGGGGDIGDGSRMKDAIGYSDKKRKIALEMGIDPYTTNSVLQKQLDDLAWASWAGGFSFSVATLPISGAAGAGLTVTNVNSTVEDLLREKSPSELEQINRATFRAMGASASDTERILQGGAFTPTQVTSFAVHLKALMLVGLSGEVSPRLRQELEKRGMTVQDQLVPGPLR
jgi:hypothetical protein